MKNTIPAPSQARQPRSIVRVNGVAMPFVSWQVDNNSFYASDTFRCVFPISSLPAAYGPAWWFAQSQIDIEVLVGFPADPANPQPSELSSLIYGRVDELALELSDTTIEVLGRDLTSVLIDTKTDAKYRNQKASDIATLLAKNHGLTPAVTATSLPVGAYYNSEHVRLQDERSEWDLLVWLAKEEGFIVYVKGHELHFEPAPKDGQDPYVIRWEPGQPARSNVTSLRVSRNLTLAKDIKVIVRSWNSKAKKGFTVTAQAQHTRNSVTRRLPVPVTGDAQTIVRTFKNLTREAAQARANQILAEISRHEMRLEVDGPADLTLTRTDVIQLEGTGTPADQLYFVDSLVRSLDMENGFVMRLLAKNHAPQSEVAL